MSELPFLELGPLDPSDSRVVDALYGLEPALADQAPRTREALECEMTDDTGRTSVLALATRSVFEEYVPPRQAAEDGARRLVSQLLSRCYPCDQDVMVRRVAGVQQQHVGRRSGMAQQTVSDAERAARERMRVAAHLVDLSPAQLVEQLEAAGAAPHHARLAAAFYWLPHNRLLGWVIRMKHQTVSRRVRAAARRLSSDHPLAVLVRDWPRRHAYWRPGETLADHCRGGTTGWEHVRRHLDLQDGDVPWTVDQLRRLRTQVDPV